MSIEELTNADPARGWEYRPVDADAMIGRAMTSRVPVGLAAFKRRMAAAVGGTMLTMTDRKSVV